MTLLFIIKLGAVGTIIWILSDLPRVIRETKEDIEHFKNLN